MAFPFLPPIPGFSGVVADRSSMIPKDETPFCITSRWSPALVTGDLIFSARSAYVEHLMAITRWPGARPSHAAVTLRLIGIVHRGRVYACLLKTSLGTHVSLCMCVCRWEPDGADARLSIRATFQSVRNSSMLFWCLYANSESLPSFPDVWKDRLRARSLPTWGHLGRPIVNGCVIVPVHSNRVVLSMIFLRFLCGFVSIFHHWIRKDGLRVENPSDVI